MKEMNHENINSFVGACIEPNKICYMMTYCSKGSLQVCLKHYYNLGDVVYFRYTQNVIQTLIRYVLCLGHH